MSTAVLVDYIDQHRERFGVEPICRVLRGAGMQIAPSSYYAAMTRPSVLSDLRRTAAHTTYVATAAEVPTEAWHSPGVLFLGEGGVIVADFKARRPNAP